MFLDFLTEDAKKEFYKIYGEGNDDEYDLRTFLEFKMKDNVTLSDEVIEGIHDVRSSLNYRCNIYGMWIKMWNPHRVWVFFEGEEIDPEYDSYKYLIKRLQEKFPQYVIEDNCGCGFGIDLFIELEED